MPIYRIPSAAPAATVVGARDVQRVGQTTTGQQQRQTGVSQRQVFQLHRLRVAVMRLYSA